MSNTFVATHNNWDPHLAIPLAVRKANQDAIYIDPIWGIQIDRIVADGKPVMADEYDIDLDDINFNKIPMGDELFIYIVQRHHLVFAKTFNEKGEFELIKYTIPQGAKKIVIEYRLRGAPSSVGPKLTLTSKLV